MAEINCPNNICKSFVIAKMLSVQFKHTPLHYASEKIVFKFFHMNDQWSTPEMQKG